MINNTNNPPKMHFNKQKILQEELDLFNDFFLFIKMSNLLVVNTNTQ